LAAMDLALPHGIMQAICGAPSRWF
jgi:hypothetical protein